MVVANTNEPHMVSIARAAEFYGVARGTIERWCKRGYIPHQRFGRTIRVRLGGEEAAEAKAEDEKAQKAPPHDPTIRTKSGTPARRKPTRNTKRGGRHAKRRS